MRLGERTDSAYATDVYMVGANYVVIEQRNPSAGTMTIALTHEQVRLLARELQDYAESPDWVEEFERRC
jgi:hypothetical protein